MTLLESRTEGLWLAKQSAKGTPATTADKQLRKVGGDINVNRDDGEQNYSDGSRFGDTVRYVNTLLGEGSPVFQGQAGTVAHLLALFLGSESVSQVGTSGNYDHVITPGASGSYITGWKKVGASVGPLRQKFNDGRLVSLRLEASSANKVMAVTPQLTFADPGEIFTSDPVKALDTDDPFFFTEGVGRWNIDGTNYAGHSSFANVLGDAATPWYGEAVTPYDFGFGLANALLEAITLALDSAGLARYYLQIYGTSTPALAAKPLKTMPGKGSYTVDLRKGSDQTVTVTGTPTGGTFTITVPGFGTTGSIAYNATAAQVQTALEGLLGVGKITVTGGPLPGTAVKLVFQDTQSPITTTNSFTGGSTPNTTLVDNGYKRGFKAEYPGVIWSPDVAVAGNPDGGPTEIPIGATVVPIAGQPFVRFTVRNGDSAAY